MATTETTASTSPSALSVVRRIATAPTVGPFVALVLTMAFFSVKSDRFLDAQNLSLILQQVMVVGVLAIGQTLVILTAGIDLSCGTVMAFGQVIMTKLAIENGMDPLLAIALGILTCVGFGLLNGGLVTGLGCLRSSSRSARSTSRSR
jgi:fructose transport system permease protein